MLQDRSLSLRCFPSPCKNTGTVIQLSSHQAGDGNVHPSAHQNGRYIFMVPVPAQCSPKGYTHPYGASTVTQILPTPSESREVKASPNPRSKTFVCQKGHGCKIREQCQGEVTSLGQGAAALGQVSLPCEGVAFLQPPLCSDSSTQGERERE